MPCFYLAIDERHINTMLLLFRSKFHGYKKPSSSTTKNDDLFDVCGRHDNGYWKLRNMKKKEKEGLWLCWTHFTWILSLPLCWLYPIRPLFVIIWSFSLLYYYPCCRWEVQAHISMMDQNDSVISTYYLAHFLCSKNRRWLHQTLLARVPHLSDGWLSRMRCLGREICAYW